MQSFINPLRILLLDLFTFFRSVGASCVPQVFPHMYEVQNHGHLHTFPFSISEFRLETSGNDLLFWPLSLSRIIRVSCCRI